MQKRKVVLPTILGSIVEYYDFGLYAVFAPVIGELFFPSLSDFIQLLLTFSVFAVGFLMRPLGGLIFGYMGDKYGRKRALNLSIIGMAFATLTMGLLPGYNEIGIFAPLILLVVRMVQGLSIGGEGTGSAIFIMEHSSKGNLTFIGSLVMAANMFGTLSATLVGIVINNIYGLNEYNWRAGFILGTVLGLFCSYLRKKSNETPVFTSIKNDNKISKNPIRTILASRRKELLLVVALACVSTSVAYSIRGYLNTFLMEIMGYSIAQAFQFTSFCLLAMIVMLPLFGAVAEKLGQRRFLQICAVLIILMVVPAFMLIANSSNDVTKTYLGLLILAILGSSISAPAYPYAIRVFPPELRYSGVALSWNIGNALFGGTTPFIATVLVERVSVIAPAYYLIATAVTFLVITAVLTRRYRVEVR